MKLIICPGIHPPELTESFVAGLGLGKICQSEDILIVPGKDYPVYSGFHILQFVCDRLRDRTPTCPLVFISFSAGVVGAIAAAAAWRRMGGSVKAFIALDGWGVPLFGDFPIYRVSHDEFTHWSSALLGSGEESFYASPGVGHLDLWRAPQTVRGWWVKREGERELSTAAEFLAGVLERG
ncbi:hypothetical protein [Microseira wollei]|uniref:Alpha/beta hydrolase n=1 Tax=Microseira wollei NIES-4236 TaxID=2530354 RepID=A0AAV3X4F6_9CYAN|nr:hypothetical protein [Microseira wollei]GET35475.1 hypothetical protein MiSe_02170 [Microseira wollei NIES-4236]